MVSFGSWLILPIAAVLLGHETEPQMLIVCKVAAAYCGIAIYYIHGRELSAIPVITQNLAFVILGKYLMP